MIYLKKSQKKLKDKKMCDDENFRVLFYDDYAEIEGDLHLSQCIQMLLFMEQLNYNTVNIYDGSIRIRRKDHQKEQRDQWYQDHIENEKHYENEYKKEAERTAELSKKINDLESLVKQLMTDHKENNKKLNTHINKLQKKNSILKLQQSVDSKEKVSLSEAIEQQKAKYKTYGQTPSCFHVLQRVKVITLCQDFHFFNGEFGTVSQIKLDQEHLCVQVTFDEPRQYEPKAEGEEPWVMQNFWFDPEDLVCEKMAIEIDSQEN